MARKGRIWGNFIWIWFLQLMSDILRIKYGTTSYQLFDILFRIVH